MTSKEATTHKAAPGDFEFKNTPPWLQSKDQEVRAGSCLLSLLSAPTKLVTGYWNVKVSAACLIAHCF